jgi:hypothetical protein
MVWTMAGKPLLWPCSPMPLMPISPYKGGKHKRHFTLSDAANEHLAAIAADARLSKSETLERLIRSTPIYEGSATLCNGAWRLVVDHSTTDPLNETV